MLGLLPELIEQIGLLSMAHNSLQRSPTVTMRGLEGGNERARSVIHQACEGIIYLELGSRAMGGTHAKIHDYSR